MDDEGETSDGEAQESSAGSDDSGGSTDVGPTQDDGGSSDGGSGAMSSSTDASEDGTADPVFSLAGSVSRLRQAAPADSGDGVGTLYVAALSVCELGAPLVGSATVLDADFADVASVVDFTIEGLESGSVHLALFLDDNEDADPMAPLPSPGDLVYATGSGPDGLLSCIEVAVDDADVTDVELMLTATVPGG